MERSTIFHGKIHERVRFTKYLKYLVGITWEGLGEILERLKLYEGLKKHNEKIWTVWRWWIHFLKMINHPIFIVFVGPMMFGFQRWDGWPYHIDEMATWFACRWSAGSLVCNQPLGKKTGGKWLEAFEMGHSQTVGHLVGHSAGSPMIQFHPFWWLFSRLFLSWNFQPGMVKKPSTPW